MEIMRCSKGEEPKLFQGIKLKIIFILVENISKRGGHNKEK